MNSIEYLLKDNKRGATSIYRDALLLLRSQAIEEIVRQSHSIVVQLAQKFPMMGLMLRLRTDVTALKNPDALLKLLDSRLDQLSEITPDLAQHSVMGIEGIRSVMTISNSNSVITALAAYHQKRSLSMVYVLRSAPANEGELTAIQLQRYGIPAKVIEDNESPEYLKSTDGCIVGCDLLTDEYFINKTGSADLISMALNNNLPAWVISDDLRYIQSPIFELEENSVFEIIPFPENLTVVTNNGFAEIESTHRLPSFLVR